MTIFSKNIGFWENELIWAKRLKLFDIKKKIDLIFDFDFSLVNYFYEKFPKKCNSIKIISSQSISST